MSSGFKKRKKTKGLEYRERPKFDFEYKPKHKVRTSFFLLRVPTDLKDMFKDWCDQNGYKMTGNLIQHMKSCLEGRK